MAFYGLILQNKISLETTNNNYSIKKKDIINKDYFLKNIKQFITLFEN